MADTTPTIDKTLRKGTKPTKLPTVGVAGTTDALDAAPAKGSAQKIVAKAKETTSKLATEAVSAARNAANEGKDRASEALTSVSKAVEGAATLIEDKVGPAYGSYAHKAADQVSGFANVLQSKDIDDLISDTREFVRKQPMIAIGAAAAIGFVLTRLVKIGGKSSDSNA